MVSIPVGGQQLDAPEAVELIKWREILSKCDTPAAATALSPGQSVADLFRRAIYIRNCAAHRYSRIPVKNVEGIVRDAWSFSQALKDSLRAIQLLYWLKELENLVAHFQL